MAQRARPEKHLLTGEMASPGRTAYDALVTSWMLHLEAGGKSPSTRRLYRLVARQLADFLELQGMPLAVASLTREHVESFIIAEQRAHPGNSTAETKYKSLRSFFTWLLGEGEIRTHPMARMDLPQSTTKEVPVIDDQLVMRLLNVVKNGRGLEARRDHALLRVLVDTPLRRTEVANLTLAAVDLSARELHVIVKGNRQRTVPIGVKTAQALDRYLRIRPEHRYADLPRLWLGRQGPLTGQALDGILKRRAREAGIEERLHLHLFRHLFAHSWLEAGGQERDLMRLGGWRSTEVMRKYAEKLADQRAVEAYRRLSPGDRF